MCPWSLPRTSYCCGAISKAFEQKKSLKLVRFPILNQGGLKFFIVLRLRQKFNILLGWNAPKGLAQFPPFSRVQCSILAGESRTHFPNSGWQWSLSSGVCLATTSYFPQNISPRWKSAKGVKEVSTLFISCIEFRIVSGREDWKLILQKFSFFSDSLTFSPIVSLKKNS